MGGVPPPYCLLLTAYPLESDTTMNQPSQAAIGRALGLSPASMTKLKGQGMPVHSVEAARTWRAINIAPTMHGHIKRQAASVTPSPSQALPHALALLDIAAAALASGQTIDALVPVLRLALRAVPEHERDPDMMLPAEVMDVLTHDVFTAIKHQDTPRAGRADYSNDDGKVSFVAGTDMTDDEAAEVGRFWYQVAAGEMRLA